MHFHEGESKAAVRSPRLSLSLKENIAYAKAQRTEFETLVRMCTMDGLC